MKAGRKFELWFKKLIHVFPIWAITFALMFTTIGFVAGLILLGLNFEIPFFS